jgi:uracil-DNA glycosylase
MLRDAAACAARRQQLAEPHVAPLGDFVSRLRVRLGRDMPDFDPWDGGTRAKVLFLLEAPGRRAVGSGFISRNNPDGTAKNFFELNRDAGIDRRDTVTWNVVPWYIGDGQRIRAARSLDISEGTESLSELLKLLPELEAIVLLGRKAQRATRLVTRLRPDMRVFAAFHPSPLYVNRAPGNRDRILGVLHAVAAYIYSKPAAG